MPLALSLGFGNESMHEVLWKIWKTTHLPQSLLPMSLGRLFNTQNMYGALRRHSCGKPIGNKQQPNLIYDVLIYVVPGLDVNEDLKQYSLFLSLLWLPEILHMRRKNKYCVNKAMEFLSLNIHRMCVHEGRRQRGAGSLL